MSNSGNKGDDWDFKVESGEAPKKVASKEGVQRLLEKRPKAEKKLNLDHSSLPQNAARKDYANTKGGKNINKAPTSALLSERIQSIAIDFAAAGALWLASKQLGTSTLKIVIPLAEQYQLRYLFDHDYVYYMITGMNFFVLYLLLWVPLVTYTQKTPGKFVSKIFIEDMDGGDLGFVRTLMRETLFKAISLFSVIGLVMILFQKDRRGLHDLLAKSTVRRS
jgi:uncharacterized RDD family membrane protein YckC